MNWLKYKNVYFILSFLMISIATYALVVWGLPVGLDFKGGANLEYSFTENISSENLALKLEEDGFEVNSIQTIGNNSYLIRTGELNPEERQKVTLLVKEFSNGAEELRFETVGPSIGKELIKKTFYAILMASVAILLWIAYQFRSFKFGIAAILAMFHDTYILIGAFAFIGHFFTAEVDFLFVTAVLTTLSFSVHDTIVVFDRIREIGSKSSENIENVTNQALTETMVRSLNNSFTIIFMLSALLLLGGSTIKWFAAALLVGTVLGTYSSPFVASPLLVIFDRILKKGK